MFVLFPTILGFNTFAQYVCDRGRKVLICDGYRFYRHGNKTNVNTYWRCSGYVAFKCQNRAVTMNIGGYEMVKLRMKTHNHDKPTK